MPFTISPYRCVPEAYNVSPFLKLSQSCFLGFWFLITLLVRTRMLAYTWFSGNMASGKVVYSTPDEQQWEPVGPRTINHTLWKVACSKK